MTTTINLDARAGRLAERQLGLLTNADARRLGFTRHQIEHRLRTGRWRRLARAVYLITGAPPTWQQSALAACLGAPAGAAASHLTAAALWGLGPAPVLPHVTVPPGSSARLPIARIHRSALRPDDLTTVGPIPVTRAARTIVDCAALVDDTQLHDLVDSAVDAELVRPRDLVAAMARATRRPGRQGTARLRSSLATWTDPIQPGSPAEARLLRAISAWDIPEPVLQHEVRTPAGAFVARVDLAWPAARVGLEYDGTRWHGPRAIEHDEARHGAVEVLGWRLLHADRSHLRAGDQRLRVALAGELRRAQAA